ncbi:type II toxin-antitoxin system Phd/YefM family antitoxin [Furfurilactobacillus rossiae]|nr:hypothetical protein [Furfurilactobacillus rossiae]MCF6166016.1 type II toxin-antitoxin system prevent-host-death family antitoxin [Furfurilactobacillus rossiae]QFR67290.1 type II toxin-antitoxin system prevent-host-death family antitoxin [Furfurilactobacillus rossiae]QLE60219.1 hypothetical protein LROSRS0_0171 [Furfurilactobacillus rossiae]QLE62994.1 hypothetical protein LROSL1_0174 [Furfurilactobacillus rossiae]
MTKSLPMSALRNYNNVFDEVRDGTTIRFTKNGKDAGGVLVNTQEWEHVQAEIRLLTELNRADRNFGTVISHDKFRQKHRHE